MRPTVGTWCLDCQGRGHKCAAQMFDGSAPLCLPCADGDPCSFERVAAKGKTAVEEDEWGEPMPGPVKSVPLALLNFFDVGKQDTPGRWLDLLGPKAAEEIVADAHADAKEGRHLKGDAFAQKPAAVAPEEKSGTDVPPLGKEGVSEWFKATPGQQRARIKAGMAKSRAEGTRIGRPVVEVDRARMTELRAQGLSWRQIAKELGVGKSTVQRALKREPGKSKEKRVQYTKITPEVERNIVDAAKGGMTVNAISRKFKVGYYEVDKIVDRDCEQEKKAKVAAPKPEPKATEEVHVQADRPAITKLMNADEIKMWDETARALAEQEPVAEVPTAPTDPMANRSTEIKPAPPISYPSETAEGGWADNDFTYMCRTCGIEMTWSRDGNCQLCKRDDQSAKPKDREKLTITFEISEAGAIAMFSDLSISQKAAALRAALEASWRV
jgi:hypothetical protein